MTTDTSGANLLPDRSSPSQPEQAEASRPEAADRNRWRQALPEKISARRARRSERADRARRLREVDHLATHPDIPSNLIEALQHGTTPGDTLTSTTVNIDGQHVRVAVSPNGTGIPEPDSQGVWDGLCDTVREISARPYCADVVMPLPQEIAAVDWTTAGQTINVTPCKPRRLRGILGIVLFPLARTGEVMTASAASTAAALALGTGSLSPIPIPAEPAPDLQPKTRIAERIPQVASTTRPEPAKVRIQVRPSTSTKVKVTTRTSAPRPAVTPKATRAAKRAPATPSISSAPEKVAATPKASETAPPTTPAGPTGTGLETLLPSLTSLLRGSHP